MTATNPSTPLVLYRGGHDAGSSQKCFNEFVAWAAGEPHSASPRCVSPVIQRFGMTLNDRLDDTRRQLLVPFLLRSLGTAGDGRDEERRELCRAWLVEQLPGLFERAGMPDRAAQLRELLPGALTDEAVLRVLREARDEAYEARRKAYSTLRTRVRDEVRKLGLSKDSEAVAVAVAVAVAAEVAEAVAAVAEAVAEAAVAEVAEAAVAEAAVAAVAVAEAAVAEAAEAEVAEAAVAAVAVAEAAVAEAAEAAVAEAAVAEAAEAAVAAPYGSSRYWAIRDAVAKAVRAKVQEVLAPTVDELLPSALELFDRMLPPEPVQEPVVVEARELVAAAMGGGES